MKPTNDDLARLIPEARREHEAAPPLDESPGPMAADALDVLKTLLLLVASPVVKWHEVRTLALQALYLCALIAWEAGRRVTRPGGLVAVYPDGVQRRVSDAAMFVNDGNGGLRPLDGPVAKPDVEALLRDAAAFGRWAGIDIEQASGCTDVKALVANLAAAFRAERERHTDTARCLGEAVGAEWQVRQVVDQAHGHLRAVLDWGWHDGTAGPEVVRKARAFLAGDGQAPRPEDDVTWLRRMWDEEVKAHTETQAADTAKMHEIGRLKSQLAGERANLSRLEAKLSAEDEAHAHTRAELADAKGGLVAAGREVERLQGVARETLATQNRVESEVAGAKFRENLALRERDALTNDYHAACAERDTLRAKLAEVDTMIAGLIAWAKKGRA
jgi:hypothetical protein